MALNIPLKFKLMAVLVTLSVAILLTYAALALTDFRSDKLAYVFDSTLSHARSTSNQLRSDLEFALDKIEFYTRGFQTEAKDFHPYSRNVFAGEKRFSLLASFHSDPTKGEYVRSALLKNNLATETDVSSLDSVSADLIKDTMSAKVALRTLPGQISKWLVGVRVEDASGAAPCGTSLGRRPAWRRRASAARRGGFIAGQSPERSRGFLSVPKSDSWRTLS